MGIADLPPHTCVLALGSAGLSGLLAHWGRVNGVETSPLSLLFALLGVALLCGYAAKARLAPASVRRDAGDAATLPLLCGGLAAAQLLAVRFSRLLPAAATQGAVVVCYSAGLVLSARWAVMVYRRGLSPEPAWFPGFVLIGVANITSQAAGPPWLRALMPLQFWLLVVVYAPVKARVVYRMFFSRARASVAPNASMALLMAPASTLTLIHFSTGKPGGDTVGLALFALSTLFCLLTLGTLFVRRDLWARSFHQSYVAFTFPCATTATAAVVAVERHPVLGTFVVLRVWASLLTALAVCVASTVVVRYLWYLKAVVSSPGAEEKKVS